MASAAHAVPLRSGFYALPLDNSKSYVAARPHSHGLGDEHEGDKEETRLFVTSVPPTTTSKHVKQVLSKIFATDVSAVDVVAPAAAAGRFGASTSLLGRDIIVSSAKPHVQRLFQTSSSSLDITPAASYVVTVDGEISWPPKPYSTSLALPPRKVVAESYLALSATRHKAARPHRSSVIAHSDSWMNDFDQRKLSATATAPADEATLSVPSAASGLSATQRKKLRKAQAAAASANAPPAPGSAAAALAAYAATQAKLANKNHNPDEPDEEGWTLVTSGGKHGKSMLPSGAVPTVTGYGATTFRVGKPTTGPNRSAQGRSDNDDGDDSDSSNPDLTARERKKRKAEYESGVRKTVGSGFYRFTKQAERKTELANLKRKFEDDKSRLGRMRTGFGDRSTRGERPSRSQRSFKPY
ncbi:hypothetical protein OIV83_006435 [Microbotryomycetes sp. JL201]|nr:hypothetical protein OIV83_006435 [Microbotryomycetes sp. JL201]